MRHQETQQSGGGACLGRRLCFTWRKGDWFLLLWALLIAPAAVWLPVSYSYENGPIENMQLLVLTASIVLCFRAEVDKNFFKALGWGIMPLFLREINCGRTVFFPKDAPNQFYSWKELPYGYLAHPLFGLFIAGVVVYFFASGAHKVLWRYMLHAKIAVWTWLFAIAGVGTAYIAEHCKDDMLEELAESLFYFALVSLVCFHSLGKGHSNAADGAGG